MAHSQWLQTSEFAELAGISRQAAAKALRVTLSGGLWRDGRLEVRRVPGRGGRKGTTYQVALESLPSELRQSPAPLPVDDGWRSNRTTSGNATIAKRLATISPSLEQARGSRARALAIAKTAIQSSVSERTIYRWVDRYEAYGIRGLARAKPNNAGERRVVVSRDFDRAFFAAPGSLEQLRAVATQLQQAIKGLWASRAEAAGVTEVRRLAEFQLIEICEAQGLAIPRTAIRLSRPYVERFAHYRVVNQRQPDAPTSAVACGQADFRVSDLGHEP